MKLALLVIAALGWARVGSADTGATARHLMAGVTAFKDGRYEAALVELRVVQSAPDAPADLAFYLGPTLVKLGRYSEAIDVFLGSQAPRDELTDFYLGEAYYQLKLYRKARALFAELRARGLGPVLDEGAERYVAAVDELFRSPPPAQTIDYYVEQARENAGDPLLAAELLDEARLVELLAVDHRSHGELVASLAAAWNRAGRPTAAIDLLTHESALTGEATWQLARAYAAVRDGGHAAPLLDAIVKAHGAHAAEAAALRTSATP